MADKEQFETVSDGLLVRAPAKINLSLLIAGRRPDGFHEIDTIMAKINYCDELLIQHNPKPGIEVTSQGPCWAPQGKENIIYRACDLFLKNSALQADLKVTLTKNIPAGSGLGSASSDAAAALLGLNKLLKSPISDEILHKIAAELGSDVSFFLDGPLAICKGKGEEIDKIDKIFDFSALLVLPNVTVSTKKVYENYGHDSTLLRKLNSQITPLIEKNRFDLIPKVCANMLQISSFGLHPELAELKTEIESLGLGPLCLSGSGSAMFCITDNAETAQRHQRIVADKVRCKSIIVSNNRW